MEQRVSMVALGVADVAARHWPRMRGPDPWQARALAGSRWLITHVPGPKSTRCLNWRNKRAGVS